MFKFLRFIALCVLTTAPSLAQSVLLNPSSNQAVNQPTGTSLSVSSLNMMVNATLFAGGDIGAQVNAAIASSHCGTVLIPAGAYAQTTTIMKPRCVNLVGQGASSSASNHGTMLTCSGCTSIIISDTDSSAVEPGSIRDLSINSSSAGSGVGVQIGGTATSGFGDHQLLLNVDVYNFAHGYQFGNNAWDTTVVGGTIHGSSVGSTPTGTAVYYPSGLTNSGENLAFFGTTIFNAAVGMELDGGGEFYLHSVAFDYNQTAIVGSSVNVTCFGCHFEQSYYPLVAATGVLDFQTYGGVFLVGASAGPTSASAFIYNSGTASTVLMSQPKFHSTGSQLSYCVQSSTGGYNQINLDQPPDQAGAGCAVGTNVAAATFGVTINDPINAQSMSYGVPLYLQRDLYVGGGLYIGGNPGATFTASLPNCTISYQSGVAVSHTGSACP